MVVCLNRVFSRLFKKADIDDTCINKAIYEVFKSDFIQLGHNLYKKRIAARHKGKRGGYRSILYYRKGDLIVFMYLFAKKDRANITVKEMKELIEIARNYDVNLVGKNIQWAIEKGILVRWNYEEP
jgi:hypothetical protein